MMIMPGLTVGAQETLLKIMNSSWGGPRNQDPLCYRTVRNARIMDMIEQHR